MTNENDPADPRPGSPTSRSIVAVLAIVVVLGLLVVLALGLRGRGTSEQGGNVSQTTNPTNAPGTTKKTP